MSYVTFELAGDAIEAYVDANFHPLDQLPWFDKVPENYGYPFEEWQTAATDIVSDFNKLLPNKLTIQVKDTAKETHRTKALGEFQRYLAAVADKAASEQALKALEV